ncbi:MAG: hypothetical protein IBJ03_04510 [Gemmatimonadaceae bacterium]|nr:hypothetical protein [Gemmatimonadaceae bacterium]
MFDICWIGGRLLLLGALLAVAVPLGAQDRGVSLTLRTGIAGPDDAYQSNCGHSSLAFSADLQGRRQLFPQLSIDHHSGSGGGDVGCIPAYPDTAIGGLRLENSTRLSAGVGGRAGWRMAYIEGVLRGGFIVGTNGYTENLRSDGSGERGFRPQVGGQVSAVFFRTIVLSGNLHWTRLTMDRTRANGGPTTTTTDWAPMTTVQIGVRIPVWRGSATN